MTNVCVCGVHSQYCELTSDIINILRKDLYFLVVNIFLKKQVLHTLNGVVTGRQRVKKEIAWKDILQNVILWLLLGHTLGITNVFFFLQKSA